MHWHHCLKLRSPGVSTGTNIDSDVACNLDRYRSLLEGALDKHYYTLLILSPVGPVGESRPSHSPSGSRLACGVGGRFIRNWEHAEYKLRTSHSQRQRWQPSCLKWQFVPDWIWISRFGRQQAPGHKAGRLCFCPRLVVPDDNGRPLNGVAV